MSRIATVSLELEELRLVAAAKAGDKDAYMQLVRRHQVAVFHAAYLLTESAAQAETVTLQAFVQTWGSLRRRPVTVPFGEWVLASVAPAARGTPRVDGDPRTSPDVSGAVLAALDHQPRRPRLGSVAAIAAIVAIAAAVVIPAQSRTTGSRPVVGARLTPLTPLAGAERCRSASGSLWTRLATRPGSQR